MVIVYADDDQASRRLVLRALEMRGHTVFTLDTSNAAQLQQDALNLLQLTKAGLKLDVLVLDGHNVLTDSQGRAFLDVTPLGLLNWLYQNELGRDCLLILYSNDNVMVQQANQQKLVNFRATICKVGEGGGLQGLLASLDSIAETVA
jgi:hypothetical protein